jgi:nucleotidyltransferase/DNA polymerase involved in DNA repair
MHSTAMSVADICDLQRIPGVGPSLAQDLADLGIRRVADLRRRSAERLYQRLAASWGSRAQRCTATAKAHFFVSIV